MRASTRRRITLALVGLLVLVLVGWFVQDAVAGDARSNSMVPPGNETVLSGAWHPNVDT